MPRYLEKSDEHSSVCCSHCMPNVACTWVYIFLGGEMLNKMSNAMVPIRVAAHNQFDLQLSGLCLLVFDFILQNMPF